MTASSDSDAAKLHSEINQYINQKLVIVNIAITTFGVVMGWVVTGLPTNIDGGSQIRVQPVSLLLPAVLLIVLAIMLWYIEAINKQMHILSTYLIITRSSKWEERYQRFIQPARPKGKSGFSIQDDMPYIVFCSLIAVAISVPSAVWILYGTVEDPKIEVAKNVFRLVSCCSAIFWLCKYHGKDLKKFRRKTEMQWRRCLFSLDYREEASDHHTSS
jgi:hypothetical protein